MKIVLTLLVRDEEDIIGPNIDYHLRQGVDFIIVTDNRSQDATPEILREYERAGVLSVIDEPADDYAQSKWVTRMARLAATEHGADWVINSDADEFWWPADGTLRATLSEAAPDTTVFVVHRRNFLPVEGEDEGAFYERMLVRERLSRNAVGAPLPPKVCHRADPGIVVAQGNHSVEGIPVRRAPADRLEIFHFPMRSYEQFERKIVLGGQAYERNTELGPEVGRTWRELYKLHQAGGLQDRYREDVLDEARLDAGIASGELVRDTRLRDYLLVDGAVSEPDR